MNILRFILSGFVAFVLIVLGYVFLIRIDDLIKLKDNDLFLMLTGTTYVILLFIIHKLIKLIIQYKGNSKNKK